MTQSTSAHPASPSLVLVRHGETEWSLGGRHTGRTDVPLTAVGESQARAAGRVLEGRSFGLVLSSPRRRAVDTAMLAGFGEELEVDGDLAEWDYGAYEGLTSAEISERFGEEWNLWVNGVEIDAEGRGEEAADLLRRDLAVIHRAQAVLEKGEDVLVFSHGHFLRTLAATWVGLPVSGGEYLALDTASISVLGFEHSCHVVRSWNRTPWAESVAAGSPEAGR
ncbi:histidine phosphatase family protein [Herbiconiux moechotypicola]|uniref:Histidine phosphatase family protein n=1 Tax=Herbiconiux moechotypicola TaxID=637393 RepID=A0ABN3E1Q0_9MICO|nr:histidine phosphatase family protein [Herbiconiux moechotypicola]MCS5731082.1 histidine phosphatase family protein [Herbiconiux moechotypicola]